MKKWNFLPSTLALCVFLGCPASNSTKSEAAQPAKAAPDYSSVSLSALSLDGLTPTQQSKLKQFAAEEVCPCPCPKTFAGCLEKGAGCQPAVILGQWMVDQLIGGTPVDTLLPASSKEIASFSSVPKKIDYAEQPKKGAQHPSITIVEFADFQCAHCQFAARELHLLSKQHAKDVQVVFKNFPLSVHPMGKAAALAAEAARRQGKFWEFHDALFATQNLLSDDLIIGHAKALKLNLKKFEADQKSPSVLKHVDDSLKEGQGFGIDGTPALFFNGRMTYLPYDAKGMATRLAMEKARSSISCK